MQEQDPYAGEISLSPIPPFNLSLLLLLILFLPSPNASPSLTSANPLSKFYASSLWVSLQAVELMLHVLDPPLTVHMAHFQLGSFLIGLNSNCIPS